MGVKYARKSRNVHELLMVRGVRPDGKYKWRWIGDIFARMQSHGLTVYKGKDGLYQLRQQFRKGNVPMVHKDVERIAGIVLKELDAEKAMRKRLAKQPPEQIELPLEEPQPVVAEQPAEEHTTVGAALKRALEASGKTVEGLVSRPSSEEQADSGQRPYFEFSFDPANGPTLADVIRAVDLLSIRVGHITVRGFEYAR